MNNCEMIVSIKGKLYTGEVLTHEEEMWIQEKSHRTEIFTTYPYWVKTAGSGKLFVKLCEKYGIDRHSI